MLEYFVYKMLNIFRTTLEKWSKNIRISLGNLCFFHLGAQVVVTGDWADKNSGQAGRSRWVISACWATSEGIVHTRKTSIAKAPTIS